MRRSLSTLMAAVAIGAVVPAVAATPAHAGPGPFYWLINVDSGKAVMPYNESKATGAAMVQRTSGNLGAQHWKIEGSGTHRVLYNRNSHLCLLAPIGGDSVLRQQYCNDTTGDLTGRRPIWRSSNHDAMWAGLPVTWRSDFSDQCMDALEAGTADDTLIIQYPCHGGPNQQFRLVYVPGT
ncbi:RICIN domain-containing protein [Actinocorallia longicatena]|uniref:Ricin B lectin domain-containing protein n=1 Tax=Actinocorallia longicatena TaxID=111803 RepID=A0ABP6QJX9_9ACTN